MDNQNILPWGQHTLLINRIKKTKIADLSLYLILLKNDLKIAYTYASNITKGNSLKKAEENLDWNRWPIKENISSVQISPALPDRPLLVKPESTLNLPKNFETKVYARFPVSIKISVVYGNKTDDLTEVPSVKYQIHGLELLKRERNVTVFHPA